MTDSYIQEQHTINPLLKRGLKAAINSLVVMLFLFVLFLAYGVVPNRWYHVLYVYSGSMAPTIHSGDVIIITPLPDTLETGMIVSMSVNDSVVTHRIVYLRQDGFFLTQGDANNTFDRWDYSKVKMIGLYKARIPYLGYVLAYLQDLVRITNSGAWFVDQENQPLQADLSWGETPAIQPEPCTYSFGYWNNHEELWPLEEMMLGGEVFSKEEALNILKMQPEGSAIIILLHQLIATKLNFANGASYNEITTIINEADAWLGETDLGDDLDKDTRKTGIKLAGILESYNIGKIGPGHCGGIDEIINEPIIKDPPSPEIGEQPAPTIPTIEVELPEPVNCTYTPEYWKIHTERWSAVEILIGTESLVPLTHEQVLEFLTTPPDGDVPLILLYQLLSAKLNILNGADDSEIAPVISFSEAWYISYLEGAPMPDEDGLNFALLLENYNKGVSGPGLCSDDTEAGKGNEEITETPTPAVEVVIEPTATPEPSLEPTADPTEEPAPELTQDPTEDPIDEPTPEPTQDPTPDLTEEPTPEPTEVPTEIPTEDPTEIPTEIPTEVPTETTIEEPATQEPTALESENAPPPTETPTPTSTSVEPSPTLEGDPAPADDE